MKYIKLLTLTIAIAVFAISCNDNNTNIVAEQMSLTQLGKTPGFTWIYSEMDKYNPTDSIVDEIKLAYNSGMHRFIVFAKPSCSCPGKHMITPSFIKTLEVANIPLDKCEIFTMSAVGNQHPYIATITLKDLPTILVLKGDEPIFSISDTMNSAVEGNPNFGITVEGALLLGLKK